MVAVQSVISHQKGKKQVEDEIRFAVRTKILADRNENWFLFLLVAIQIHVVMLQRICLQGEVRKVLKKKKIVIK